jgi:Sulfatase-modifying factor enzyme 1/Concanavalin A-like lectin/glucanases superfamily
MKTRFFTLLVALLLSSMAGAQTYDTNSLTNGLVAQWLLNGNADDTLGVSPGVASQVVWTNATNAMSTIQNMAYFNGNSAINVNPTSNLYSTTNGFSLLAWINPATTGSTSDNNLIYVFSGNYQLSFGATVFNSELNPLSGAYPPFPNYWNSKWHQSDLPNPSDNSGILFKTKQWYLIGITYDGSQVSAYINNNKLNNSDNEVPIFPKGAVTGSFTSALQIGFPIPNNAYPYNNAFPGGFQGYMYDLRIYNRALSSDEVAALYAMESTPPAPPTTTDTFGTGTNQFGIDFVTVGNPGNSNDTTGYGGVPYTYRIGKYTISQNQVDAATRNGLQNVTAGAWSSDQPATSISWYAAAAYVNWLNTSQGYRPAYNLTYTNGVWNMALWPTSSNTNGNVAWTLGGTNLFRNALCHYFLPSENEWYKAAYYDPNKNGGTGGYWLYPNGSDLAPTPVPTGTNSGTSVYNQPMPGSVPASVFQSGGLSPSGTMGQLGNVRQWMETTLSALNNNEQDDRVIRGGEWYNTAGTLCSDYRYSFTPHNSSGSVGFRVARVDELLPLGPTNPQTITFPSLPTLTLTNSSYTLGATADSGLPVTYTIGDSTVAGITNGTLIPLRVGITTVVATQAGDSNYLAATPVTNQLVVSKASNTISFAALASRTYGSGTFSVGATASSGLPVTYSTPNTNLITISGSNVAILGAGTATIIASQAGNSNYLAAASVTNTLVIVKASNTIASFGSIPSQTYSNGATVTITPPIASSSLPVTVMVKSGPATISGNTVTLTGAGTVVLAANQSGNGNYLAATEMTTSFSVGAGAQSISFPAIPNQTYGNGPVNLGATASSGLGVNYSSSSTNVSISSNLVTILGAGTATITASQNGNSNWIAAVSVTNTMVIAKASNTIAAFSTISSQTYSNGGTVTITPPTASSSLPVTVMVKSGPATISGNTVTLTGAGTVVLAANQSGNGNYLAATEVTTSFSVEKSSQTIGVFPVIPGHAYGDEPFSVSAPNASSGLPVVLSVVSGPATISSNTVTITGVGTVVLGADQAGNSNYLAAAQVTTRFSVVPSIQPLPQQITEDLIYGVDPITLASTNLLGFPLSYSVSGPAIISGYTLTITGGGTVTLVTSQVGNANYLPATVTNSFVVNPAPQILSAQVTNPVTYGVSPIALVLTNALGLPLTYSVTGPASLSNNLLSITGGGTVTLVTSQAGNSNYLPASITNSFVVNPATQIFTPDPVATRTYGSLPFGLTLPTNASGLPITARIVSGPATLSGTNIILNGTGTVTLAYEAPGNDLYAAASVTNSFTVTNGPTNLRSQTITFKALAAKAYGSAPQGLAGSASSKLPVTYWSSNTNVAVINGTNAVITGAGSTVIAAYQPGDGSTFNPAAPVSQTLLVNQSSQKLTLKAPKSVAYGSTPAAITATSSAGLPVTLTSSDPSIATITNSGTNTLLVPTGVGTITLTASQAGNTNVGAAIPLGQVVVITPGVQTITFAPLGTATYGAAPITLSATSSAGLPVTFSSSATNVATISGNMLTITGAGSAKITATQAGSKLWAPAKAITQTLTVAKAPQTISFSSPQTVNFTYGGLVTLAATASSGLPVAYKSGNTKVLSITGATCVIAGKGTTTVVASQPGGANYLPATSVTNTITVQ